MKKWLNEKVDDFSYFYQTQVSLGSGLWVLVSVTPYKTLGLDFADVTLADDDTNSILADDANRANWS